MRIDRILGIFRCLSCGYKGNIFHLYDTDVSTLDIIREKLRRKLKDIRLSSVGLSMPKGYVPYIGNWRNINPSTYKEFEAFHHHQSDFIGRLVFPIRDITGRIVVFLGRDETNTLPKKYYFWPSHIKLPLYPAKVTPIHGKVILVEGIFDMMNLYDKGLKNAVCCFGTNNFNEEKLNTLKIQGIESIDVMYDADGPGQKAADQVKALCEEHSMPCRNVRLKDGSDPGSLSETEINKLKVKLY